MSMSRNSYHHGNLKTELVTAGISLADKSGFEAISLRELARDTHVTPAAALRHFVDLAHLKAEISQEARQELARQCLSDWALIDSTNLTRESAIARFEVLGRRYVKFAQEHTNLFNAAFALCESTPSKPDDPSPWSLLEEVVEDLIALGVISQSLRDSAPLIAWSMVHGLATLESHNLVHVSKYTGNLGDLVVNSLQASLFV
jgi:AcrR family transcriptional regulator